MYTDDCVQTFQEARLNVLHHLGPAKIEGDVLSFVF